MSETGPVTLADQGVTVAVRVTPKARHQRIDGIVADADGRRAVKISVTAVPEDSKANAAVIALVAKTWKVPKGCIAVQSGATSRRKILKIAGDAPALKRRLEAVLKGMNENE